MSSLLILNLDEDLAAYAVTPPSVDIPDVSPPAIEVPTPTPPIPDYEVSVIVDHSDGIGLDIDASKEVDFDIALTFTTDVNDHSDVDVEHIYDIDVDIDGNEALFAVAVTALGENTSSALDLGVLTWDAGSWITAVGYAASDGM